MTLADAARLGGLTLLSPLGSGGQATVFRARRPDGSVIALKVIEPREDREGERARREARALSRLEHPSLPRCTRLIEEPNAGWLALELELVEGRTLDEAARDLDPHARRMALRHVAAALGHLHAHAIVHRDVKPSNVMVTPDFAQAPTDASRCKLVDLGIAVAATDAAPLTVFGHPGTVPYMAPEALDPVAYPAPRGKPTLDVFAFGVTAWVVLRGSHPTGLALDAPTSDFTRAYGDHVGAEDMFLPPEDLGDPFERVVARCLRLRADERPGDGGALLKLLDEALVAPTQAAPVTRTAKARAPARSGAQARAAAPAPAAPPATAPMGPVRIPTVRDVAPQGRQSRRSRVIPFALAAVAVVAVVAVGAVATTWGAGALRDAFRNSDGAPSEPAAATAAPLAGGMAPPAFPAPALDWSTVRESNVKHSTTHGCETKVLAGWFRVRCVDRPGETLRIVAPADAQARISHEGDATTLLMPLVGRDQTFTFDWAGGRGVRTLHVVGHQVGHRVIESQGELSAP